MESASSPWRPNQLPFVVASNVKSDDVPVANGASWPTVGTFGSQRRVVWFSLMNKKKKLNFIIVALSYFRYSIILLTLSNNNFIQITIN